MPGQQGEKMIGKMWEHSDLSNWVSKEWDYRFESLPGRNVWLTSIHDERLSIVLNPWLLCVIRLVYLYCMLAVWDCEVKALNPGCEYISEWVKYSLLMIRNSFEMAIQFSHLASHHSHKFKIMGSLMSTCVVKTHTSWSHLQRLSFTLSHSNSGFSLIFHLVG